MLMLSGIEYPDIFYMRFYLLGLRVKNEFETYKTRSRQYIYIWLKRNIPEFFFICGSHLAIISCIWWTFFLLFRNFLLESSMIHAFAIVPLRGYSSKQFFNKFPKANFHEFIFVIYPFVEHS